MARSFAEATEISAFPLDPVVFHPPWRLVESVAALAKAATALGLPLAVKPSREGSSIGISRVNDPGQFQSAWERAAACDETQWRAMGQAGRARVQAEFSQERVTGLYLEALESAGIAPSEAE